MGGAQQDGGLFTAQALEAGAWGVLVRPRFAHGVAGGGAVLEHEDPLLGLQSLANAWRLELGADVIGITGSAGKTSTKDILAAVLAPHRRTVASPLNLNNEIGLPLAILAAPEVPRYSSSSSQCAAPDRSPSSPGSPSRTSA